jgi:hypothetical protein
MDEEGREIRNYGTCEVTEVIPTPTHAALYLIEENGEKRYYVKATLESPEPSVHGFESMRQGLDYFEHAYFLAVQRGFGFAAGAILNWMYLQPRIFPFRDLADLVSLLGETVTLTTLRGTGVHESAFLCIDQKKAADIYASGCAPRLAPPGEG